MILSVTLNPCIDQVLVVDELKPHDTNRVTHIEQDAGGKGVNLSRVVAELGGETVATGFLGGISGLFVRSVLSAQGVHNSFIEVAGETRTNVSVEDGTGKPPTTLNERGPHILEAEMARLLGWMEELAPRANWVAMGGSLPPGVPTDIFRTLAKLFRSAGCKVLIDADGEPAKLGLEAKPDLIKPNSPECARLLGRPIETDEEAHQAARELYEKLGGREQIALISRGRRGAVMCTAEGVFQGSSPDVVVKSTIGSGDSLLGAMLWAMEEGKSHEEALRWGLAAGAATATTNGSEIAKRAKVEELFEHAKVWRIV